MHEESENVSWPTIGKDIKRAVEKCPGWVKRRIQRNELLIGTLLPEGSWEIIELGYFKSKGKWYIVVVDYYLRYLDVHEVRKMTSRAAISYLKILFSKFEIPLIVRSDNYENSMNLVLYELQEFAIGVPEIVQSSSKYPQSNGLAEAMVKLAEKLVEGDLELSILGCRTIPLDHGMSPGKLHVGWRLQGTLPITRLPVTGRFYLCNNKTH